MEINIICNAIFTVLFFHSTCADEDSNQIGTATNSSYDNLLSAAQNSIVDLNIKNEQLPVLEQDDQGNININLFVVRSKTNKLLDYGNGQLCALIQAPNYESALNNELCRFFSNILFLRRQYIKVFDCIKKHHKIIALSGKGITIDIVIRKLLAVLRLPALPEQFKQLVSNSTQIYNMKVPVTTPVTIPQRTTRNWQLLGSWNDVVGRA